MHRCNLRQHTVPVLVLLMFWRSAAGSDGGWTQALPPAIGLGIAGLYVLVDRIAGPSIELRRHHREGMRRLAARDTVAAVKAFEAAVAVHDGKLRPRSKSRPRTASAYQACRQRLAAIQTARAPAPAVTQAQAIVTQAETPAGAASGPAAHGFAPPQPFEGESGIWGYRDATGRVVIAPRYAAALEFNTCGIAAAVDRLGWAVIDTTGAVRLRPLVVDNGPDYFAEGLARFVKDSLVGFYDTCGSMVIEPRFAFAGPFSDGFAPFCEGCRRQADGEYTAIVGGRWGYVARDGRIAVEAAYEKAEPVSGGKGRVMEKGVWKTVPLPAAPPSQ